MSYVNTFIDAVNIALPNVDAARHKDSCRLDYTHFSILYSKDRKQPICCAVNIDGAKYYPVKRGSDVWKYDQSVNDYQIGKQFYPFTNQEFHKGHIVRRLDPCWGTEAISKQAEEDTFHYTNASPQHRKFNPKIWLELERNLLEKGAAHHDQKISLFSGPILHPNDKPYNSPKVKELIFIPHHFWKIVVWKKTSGKLYAVGFIQSQKKYIDPFVDTRYGLEAIRSKGDDYYENLDFKGGAVYQVNIAVIEELAGLKFNFESITLPKVKDDIAELQVKRVYSEESMRSRNRSNNDAERLSFKGLTLE